MKWNKSECKPLATEIYNVINAGRVATPRDKDVTARQLCGKAVWDTLTDVERRLAGRYISAAVRTGHLDLEQVRRDGANAWRYRRKQPEQRDTPMLH